MAPLPPLRTAALAAASSIILSIIGDSSSNGFASAFATTNPASRTRADTATFRDATLANDAQNKISISGGRCSNDKGEASSCEDPWQYNGPNYKGNVEINKLAELSSADRTAASRAEDVLRDLESNGAADTISYNGVIKAYAKSTSKMAVHSAEKVLNRMERKYEVMMHQDENVAQMIKPNVRTYSTLLGAYSRNPLARSAEESEALLERVQSLYEETGDPDLAVNTVAINSVLNHWAKSNRGAEGASRAAILLSQMEELDLVDVISYNTVADAWARSGASDAGAEAEAILRKMESRAEKDASWAAVSDYNEAAPLPNVRTYCAVIDAWSSSNHPSSATHANRILAELEGRHAATGDESLRPNIYAYGAVLNAYARSNQSDKATSALKLLRRMDELRKSGQNVSARPNIIHINTALNACATTVHHRGVGEGNALEEAMCIVRTLYKEITSEQSPMQADDFTYGTVLKACANLLPTRGEDADFIASVFRRCCKDGQVSFQVCFLLKQAASMELYRELLPPEAFDPATQRFDIEKMPRSWRRNVVERRNRKYR